MKRTGRRGLSDRRKAMENKGGRGDGGDDPEGVMLLMIGS